jgi:S-adenosylmethionine:tRNA ribosyltransferase-isomerase
MKVGRIPLPPYIRRDADGEDRARYQTVYAEETGAVAAPTAGLHFTEGLLERIRQKGVAVLPTLLHVGPGTFQPLRTEIVEAHVMEAEYYRVEADTTRKIVETRGKGRRVVAVGTTVTRALETMAGEGMEKGTLAVRDYEGWTTCYIYPPYRFQLVDALLTNFHLPRSTLLMLVCAFGGHDLILRAYEEAVRAQYRFYSYGDAMLVI